MKTILTSAFCLALAAPAFAASHEAEASEEVVAKIMAMLADQQCEMDPDDIEVEDDGYDLDDVICAGSGQQDIKLDLELNEVSRRQE